MGLNSNPMTWPAGLFVVTADHLNTEVRDPLTGIQAAGDAYTPAWTAASGAPSLGNGTLVGRVHRVGKHVDARIALTMGSSTTYGTGVWSLSLPVAAAAVSAEPMGQVGLLDSSSSTFRPGMAVYATTTTVTLWLMASNANADPSTPWTWAVGDQVVVKLRYQSA